MPLRRRRDPFDHPDWLFELKYDGFRALAVIRPGRSQLISRNEHPFASYADLASAIATVVNVQGRTVLDGEIVCLDRRGRTQFKDLLFRRGQPCFYAFDLPMLDGKDQRNERLINRKQELRRLLARVPATSALKYTDHLDGSGTALFQRVCKLDLEGIVAKHKHAPYVASREETTWIKILNPNYSQREGREELFERDRHKEPVAGWHTCAIACAETEVS
jgi:bifunctional non-homologous end joining protein LigD